jgi:hypothetical protein
VTLKRRTDYVSGKFGFHEWNLNAHNKFIDTLEEIIKEGIELATTEYPSFVCLKSPLDPVDPTIMEICLNLTEDDMERIISTVSLAEVITDYIPWCIGDGMADEDEIPELTRLRDALQAAVDKLSERIPK